MKQLLLSGCALLAAMGPTPAAARKAGSTAPAAAVTDREVISLQHGWRFIQDDVLTSPANPAVPDSRWSAVNVPHSWNRVGYYLSEPQTHINRADNVDKTQGIGWYRLSFRAPAATAGRRAWLQFDGASRTAEVWLNGVRLGEHRGGFSRFRLDATNALHAGADNELAVKTDSALPKDGAAGATFPLLGDFFVHGGLYRPVSLILTDPAHVDMMDFGGPGVYARTDSIGGGIADVAVVSRLRNDGPRSARLELVTQLVDARGLIAASARSRILVAAGGSATVPQSLTVRNARLWQGIADPYLYRLTTRVRSADGRSNDRLDQPFGIRQIRLDPEHGFSLNGKPLKLHGVGLHQDMEGKGWAMSDQDIAAKFATIRDMGANTIRLTHYQHGETVHRLADRYGFILWDEIPVVTVWTLTPEQKAAPPELAANARQQLQELIRQNFNHPSVAVWGIANEVDFGPGRPDFLGHPPATVPDPVPLLRMLNALAKAEDPGRPTVLAQCCEDRGMPQVPDVAEVTDAVGANRYFGWYYGRPSELGPHLDALHAKRPNQPLAVTEYGAGGATTIHSDDPLGGPVDPGGSNQPEEYQAWVHEQSWPILSAKPYLWATWLWNSFDFASTVRREGDSQDINTKGLVTFDGRVKKDAFYFYRANWSDAPTVHINGRRYVDRAYPVVDIRVYSNAPTTELSLNGKTLGARSACPEHICVWPAVRLATGHDQLTAAGQFPSGPVHDSIEWRLGPDASTFRIDSGALVAARASSRFGSDAFFDGGSFGSTDKAGGRGRAPVPAAIAGTTDRDLVATYREGAFRYRLPVGNGRYRVTLTFVEPRAAPGERLFDVTANGAVALKSLDIAAAAGGQLTALRRSFDVDVRNGVLELNFAPIKGQAIVSAVEVRPT